MGDNIELPKKPGNGKVIAGLVLLAVGVMFLLHQFDFFFFPHWLFRWPMWLIVWGLYVGARHDFRNSSWLIMVLIGLIFLADDAFPGRDVGEIIWPVALIIFGLWLILRRNHHLENENWEKKWEQKWERKWNKYQSRKGTTLEPAAADATTEEVPGGDPASTPPPFSVAGGPIKGDDYLDTVSIFGGVNKTILSKNFQGGEIVNIFGGAELDFTHADLNGRVIIDITQIFGGTKIIVPANWQVISDMAAVFASVDDKRIRTVGNGDANKILVLKGVSIFAGVDVRSY
jgi:predicted membrane protein